MHTNVRSIVVSGAESASSTPPVPPRRKKRKAKPAAIAKSPEGTSPTSLKKSDRKRLAPPPPPPRAARRIKSHVAEPKETTSNTPRTDDAEETLKSSITAGKPVHPLPPKYEDTEPIQTKETSDGREKNDSPKHVTEQPQKRPFMFETFSKKETNKYPPLFFTLHDFQNVMSSTLQKEEEPNDKSSVEFANSIGDSFMESFENSLDDEENEICFRVTTTNLPFEKCLDRWTATFADHFMEKFDEPNRFIFEDYIDRSNRVNIRRSSGNMCYESIEEEPAVPRLTKVRFVIESPSSSTPDYDLDENGEATCDSLQNIDPIADEEEDWNRECGVRLTEITDDMDCTGVNQVKRLPRDFDEFGDAPFNSILKAPSSIIELSMEDQPWDIIEAADEDLFNEGDSFGDPSEYYPENESFRSKLTEDESNAADVDRAEINILKSNMECDIMLAELENDCSSRLPEDNDFKLTSGDVEDGKEVLDEEKLLDLTCEIENDSIANEPTILENVNGTDDVKLKSASIEMNCNFAESRSISCEDEKQQATINESRAFDQQVITKKVDNNALSISDEAEADVGRGKVVEEEEEQRRESMQEYRRKLFVNESLRNIMNRCDFASNESEDQYQECDAGNDNLDTYDEPLNTTTIASVKSIDKLENIPSTESRIYSQEIFKNVAHFEKKESITVPVNIRRNSFLENMLSVDSGQLWTSCEIVATHAKLPDTTVESTSASIEEKPLSDRLNESAKVEPGLEEILQESKASLKKVDSTLPRSIPPKKVAEANKKTAGVAKCEVLNELLSNFSNIRLKSVSGERKSAAKNHVQITTSAERENHEEKIESKSRDEAESPGSAGTIREATDYSFHEIKRIQSNQDDSNNLSSHPLESQNTSNCSINHRIKMEALKSEQSREISSKFNFDDHTQVDPNRNQRHKIEDTSESSMNIIQIHDNDCEYKTMSYENPNRGGAVVDSVERLVMADSGEKTDAKDESHNRGAIARQLELSRRTSIEGDKSAIARRIPRPHCNNNDNNRAVTPVAVSDDQSRNTVTITPGRVRTFVKYYEIRQEATIDKDSKINDRIDMVPEHQSVFSIRRGLEAKAMETISSDASNRDNYRASMVDKSIDRSMVSSKRRDKCAAIVEEIAIENSRGCNDRVGNLIRDDYVEVKRTEIDESQMSDGDSCRKSGKKPRRKKSVKFQGGFTVIGARNPDEDGSVGNLAIRNAELLEKKKAPDRPGLKGSVPGKVDFQGGQTEQLLDTDSRSFEKRENTAQMQAPAKCEECSGINRFVPKPETPRLVFYCTV